jgi:hypothetical protein
MTTQADARKQVYSKIIRWQPTNGHAPSKVEVAGSFTDWRKVQLTKEISGGWQTTLHEIPGNRTHHFMYFADGKPVSGPSDGMAMPQGYEEEQFALTTVRGPRLFMMFSQTK